MSNVPFEGFIRVGQTSRSCRVDMSLDNIPVFSSSGRRPASLCHGLLSVVCPSVSASVCALNFSLNICFSETTFRILMKFHRNVPAVVLFRIS